jgi:hypothetical protein
LSSFRKLSGGDNLIQISVHDDGIVQEGPKPLFHAGAGLETPSIFLLFFLFSSFDAVNGGTVFPDHNHCGVMVISLPGLTR